VEQPSHAGHNFLPALDSHAPFLKLQLKSALSASSGETLCVLEILYIAAAIEANKTRGMISRLEKPKPIAHAHPLR